MIVSRTPARRLAGGLTAGLAAAALVAMSAGPGAAATVVAQATATAFEISIAGNNASSMFSGTYTVKNDGTTETSSGRNNPQVPIPTAGVANVGTLAQDATTRVVNRDGQSAACSGIAGDGATLIQVGDGRCLDPAANNNLALAGGSVDLQGLLSGGIPTGGVPFPPQLQAIIDALPALPGGGTVGAQIDAGIQQVAGAIGNPSLTLNAGAIQSACVARAPSTAEGNSKLTDVTLAASFANQNFPLVNFPLNTPPNTKVVTDADVLIEAINTALTTQLTTTFNPAGVPLAGLTGPLITQINQAVVTQLTPQLQALEDNLLDGTINKQSRTPGAIDVTALELNVLPAATEFAGAPLLSLDLANVTCGPSGRVAPASPTPSNPPVPTFVPAGEAGTAAPRTDDNGLNDTLALGAVGALAIVSGGVGVAAYRRKATR